MTQQLPEEARTFPADWASGAAGLASPSLPQGLQHYKPSPKEDTVGQPQVHLAAQQQVRALHGIWHVFNGWYYVSSTGGRAQFLYAVGEFLSGLHVLCLDYV